MAISPNRDHPRMRGEKKMTNALNNNTAGITPACAGKSISFLGRCYKSQDHPRMRGEKSGKQPTSQTAQGSPPHARGKVTCSLC